MIVRSIVLLFAVLTPFLVVGYAMGIMPNFLQAVNTLNVIDVIWLILLGAMMLGVYWWLFYIEEEEEITEEFMELDRNHDGYISRDEAEGYLAEKFEECDADHDGKISRHDFELVMHH
ncbi:MAG TPA: EF-hand domain-containing protein [Burkholderiales bacterium]|nr:EF-hand domain-containing protein [Burkholderiales bacterium]